MMSGYVAIDKIFLRRMQITIDRLEQFVTHFYSYWKKSEQMYSVKYRNNLFGIQNENLQDKIIR